MERKAEFKMHTSILVAFDVLAIAEPVIEEVRGSAQLEKILAEKDFVAVLWNARNCR